MKLILPMGVSVAVKQPSQIKNSLQKKTIKADKVTCSKLK